MLSKVWQWVYFQLSRNEHSVIITHQLTQWSSSLQRYDQGTISKNILILLKLEYSSFEILGVEKWVIKTTYEYFAVTLNSNGKKKSRKALRVFYRFSYDPRSCTSLKKNKIYQFEITKSLTNILLCQFLIKPLPYFRQI